MEEGEYKPTPDFDKNNSKVKRSWSNQSEGEEKQNEFRRRRRI